MTQIKTKTPEDKTLGNVHAGNRVPYTARWTQIRALMNRNSKEMAEWCGGRARPDGTVIFHQDGKRHVLRWMEVLAQTGPNHFTVFKTPEAFARVYKLAPKGKPLLQRYTNGIGHPKRR